MEPQKKHFKKIVTNSCRYLMSQMDRNPYSPNKGCFDRRFWGWKLIDFPEATYQRNTYALAWSFENKQQSGLTTEATTVLEAIKNAFFHTKKIQHKDGSFDQAFPNEHSFGATAFLLGPLVKSYNIIYEHLEENDRTQLLNILFKSAKFLCKHNETHGHIANHLAGAASALELCGTLFSNVNFLYRSQEFVDCILENFSNEGWFKEYEGADPGYQTLCLYYLAQLKQIESNKALKNALQESVEFLSYFVHPDGTFSGEYGSRRTSIFYPGGFAILAQSNSLAKTIFNTMTRNIVDERTTTVKDVDMGNFSPLLENYIMSLTHWPTPNSSPTSTDQSILPWLKTNIVKDFPDAGIYVRGNCKHYLIFGASLGGVVKIFDKKKKKLLMTDGGYVGVLDNGSLITSQHNNLHNDTNINENRLNIITDFVRMNFYHPDPAKFILLRFLNLTIMRNIFFGNFIKKILVNVLITKRNKISLKLSREVLLTESTIQLRDKITSSKRHSLKSLISGIPFISIHMASAGYFQNFDALTIDNNTYYADVKLLNETGECTRIVTIN